MADDKPTSDLSAVTAGSRIRQRRGNVEQAIERAQDSGGKPRRGGTPRQRGVSAQQARRTKHTGEKGERAYGAPMSTGAAESSRKTKKARFRRKNDG